MNTWRRNHQRWRYGVCLPLPRMSQETYRRVIVSTGFHLGILSHDDARRMLAE